jgi:hypothetical protein
VAGGELRVDELPRCLTDIVRADLPTPTRGLADGDAERRVVHVPTSRTPEVPSYLRNLAGVVALLGRVCAVAVDGAGIGTIDIVHSPPARLPRPSRALQTFADQAVIAIQNARLFNDRRSPRPAASVGRSAAAISSRSPPSRRSTRSCSAASICSRAKRTMRRDDGMLDNGA